MKRRVAMLPVSLSPGAKYNIPQSVPAALVPVELLDLPDWRIGVAGIPFQYKDYENTYANVGYFRGEPYAFAVVFVMSSGKTLPPIQMRGTDHWPGSPTPTNTKGIVRFPVGDDVDYAIHDGTSVKVMGIKFNTALAVIPPEILSRICGFYFVRAERKPQLYYQGISSNAWRVIEDPTALMDRAAGVSPSPSDFQIETGKYLGELRGINGPQVMDLPFRLTTGPGSDLAGIYDVGADDVITAAADRAVIFSADHFFLKQFTDGEYFLRQQGRIDFDLSSASNAWVPSVIRDQDGYAVESSQIENAIVVNVAGNSLSMTPVGNFVSSFNEGNATNYGGPIWFRAFGGGTNEVGNRSVQQRTYLGIVATGAETSMSQSTPDSAKLFNVYKFDPLLTDPSSVYDPGNELYFRIGNFHPIADWGGTFIEYHGDCFLQRTYIRHTADKGDRPYTDVTTGAAGPDAISALRFAYGNLVGIVTENVTNTAMRYMENDSRYFPGFGADVLDALSHMTQRNFAVESDLHNKGYNRTLDIKGTLGDDILVPATSGFYPTRVRYSGRYVNDTTTRDGYLSWGIDNFKDFDHHPGEIMALATLGGNLYSIQRHATRRHFIAERYLKEGAGGGAGFVLGDGETLSDRSEVISGEMGTQHQWSVIKTDRAFYAVDFSLRTAWRFGYDGFKCLSEVKLFHSDVYESIEAKAGTFSDYSVTSGDAPVCDEGIVGWYDRRHREIGWSFLWAIGEGVRYNESIVYDEKADAYMGKRYGAERNHSPYFITINEDMYSFNPGAAPWSGIDGPHSFWLHDVLVQNSTFWSFLELAQLNVMVNPESTIPKIYDNVQLAGSDVAMVRVLYNTEFQLSELDPFTANPKFWLEPRYKENMWHYTVPKTETIIPGPNQEYQPGSPLRGKWMEAEMQWLSTLPINIRSFKTFLRESLQ